MHTITFKMRDGSEISVRVSGSQNMPVRNWWVTDGPNGPRPVDICLHTYEPASTETGEGA